MAGEQTNKSKAVPTVAYAVIDAKKPTVYVGPRKVDQSPSHTFYYGDGKYLITFHYTKNDKASVRGTGAASTCQSDNCGKPKEDTTKK